jgi:hypothetical protein
MRGLPQIPGAHEKSQVLEIHKHEKNFELSHTQKGAFAGRNLSKDLF